MISKCVVEGRAPCDVVQDDILILFKRISPCDCVQEREREREREREAERERERERARERLPLVQVGARAFEVSARLAH